jgi:hypothetical protein
LISKLKKPKEMFKNLKSICKWIVEVHKSTIKSQPKYPPGANPINEILPKNIYALAFLDGALI